MIDLRVEVLSRSLLDGFPEEQGEPQALDLAVLPFFDDERPLKGLAGFFDWRSCGSLSGLLRSQFCTGACKESVLVPADPALPLRRLLLFGLGPSDGFDLERARDCAGEMVRVVSALAPEQVVLAMPGRLQERSLAEALFAAVLTGLRDHARRHGPLRLRGHGAPVPRPPANWRVVAEGRLVPRLRRILQGPPRAAEPS